MKDPYSNVSVEAFMSARDPYNQSSGATQRLNSTITPSVEVLKSEQAVDPFDTMQIMQKSFVNQMQSAAVADI